MKMMVIVVGSLVVVLAQAQDQSGCPGARQPTPKSTCGTGDSNRNITVRVAALDTSGEGNKGGYTPAGSGGYAAVGSKISPEAMADTVAHVEQHQYRACDIGLEIHDRVRDSFQRLGYFCADVEPIAAQQTGKNEYRINIHAHPGEQYRLGEVKFIGATLLSVDQLRSDFHLKVNSLFDAGAIRHGLENLQKAYAKKGHAGVTAVPVATVDATSRKINLEVRIRKTRRRNRKRATSRMPLYSPHTASS